MNKNKISLAVFFFFKEMKFDVVINADLVHIM